jgi:hypothetical protein
VEDAVAEAERLAEAERAGKLKRLGNWSLGQALGHLATWTQYGYTGSPLKVPFFIKWILRLRRRKFLYEPMRAGVKIPGVKGGTLATDPVPFEEALGRFRKAMERLKTEPPTVPNNIFGILTHDEAIALNLRHAELHLGFFAPQ